MTGTRGLVIGMTALAACASPDRFVVVTIDARPAVHDARTVTIALSNAGTTRMDALALRDQPFPVTFSISAPGRDGELGIAVTASDAAGVVVGLGIAATSIDADAAQVTLEPADFVVNTDYANDQFPSDDFEAGGFQLAALPDGTWTAAFRDGSGSPEVHIFGRRFDATGAPVQTELAASTHAFELSSQPTTRGSEPAIAASATTTLAVWDWFSPTVDDSHGVACRALDRSGRATTAQTLIATDPVDVVSVIALASGDFLAAWTTIPIDRHAIAVQVIKPDCTAPAPPQVISAAADDAHRSSLAASTDRALIAWIVDGDLHLRLASATGAVAAAEQVLVRKTATEQVVHARVAAAGTSTGGFVVAARWAQITGDGPGRIELYRVDAQGALASGPRVVTDRSASDFETAQAFGIAGRSDGTLLVTWHSCGPLGDDNLCGVFGRFMRDTGEPLGDAFVIPTTTKADQVLPSAAAIGDAFVALWSDASATPPDAAGTAVRARILYPPAPPALRQRQPDDQPGATLGAPQPAAVAREREARDRQ
jgi:hypothetical protein